MGDGKTEGVERRQRREEEGRYTLARSKRAWADTKTACHPSCPHTPSRSPQLPFLAAFSPSSLLLRPVSPPPPLEPSPPTRPHARPAPRVSTLFSVANAASSAPARGGSAKGSCVRGTRSANRARRDLSRPILSGRSGTPFARLPTLVRLEGHSCAARAPIPFLCPFLCLRSSIPSSFAPFPMTARGRAGGPRRPPLGKSGHRACEHAAARIGTSIELGE